MIIAICDDDKVFRSSLREILAEYKREVRISIDVYEFSDGKSLLESNMVFNIVFLDYQMPDMDGMMVARRLRSMKSFCSIVFVTSYPQFMIESFEVQPYRFLIKPISKQLVCNTVQSYLQQQKQLNPITVITENELRTIKSEDIIYLEASGKYCYIRTDTETIRSSKTLSQVQDLLPFHCFYRVHKTYLINMYCVDTVQNNIVFMSNGEKAVIGKSKIAEFKRVYRQFVKDYYVKV